ncbi:MAG: hypothetical protein DMF56_22210 [Acidobacteria bacterium]|nr:MAG: hypothetical protein DMF56_22210 [Acidobacteriota bacterium]
MRKLLALVLLLATATPVKDIRPPDQTFLTYPEWFLVFSPAEYAKFTRDHNPSDFPFIGHTRQFWQGYHAVWTATRGKYPFNGGYHVMIMVIGGSTTVEYLMRSLYETVIGRLAESTRRHGFTQEEKLAANVAQEYVDFIRVDPWYEFDFVTPLKRLWTKTDWFGPDLIRKWERKYFLTTEYGVKAIYGWMIKKATKAAYETPILTTVVIDDRGNVCALPRYEAFMASATALAKQGVGFREIAGNRGNILVTVIVPMGTNADHVLLRQPILTEAGRERLLIVVPVVQLSQTLRRYEGSVEHVFDY